MTISGFSKISIAALVALMVACGTSPTGRKQILLGSKSDLEALSAQQFRQLKETEPLSTDPAVVNYVACVANAVINELEGEGTDFDWELVVIDRPIINAFVMAGGKIAVFTGMLRVAETDDQLAAVLGHEAAHAIANHQQERSAGSALLGKTAQLGGAVIGGTPIARQSSYTTLQILSQFGLLLPFNRKQETEADIIGIEYMARAGFDPRASVQLWKNMGAKTEGSTKEFMSTHPSVDTRINDLIGEYPKTLPLYNEAKAAGLNPVCVPPKLPPLPEEEKDKEQAGEEAPAQPS